MRRTTILVAVTVAVVGLGMVAAGIALYALAQLGHGNADEITALRRVNARQARQIEAARADARSLQSQIRGLRRALRKCRETHGRQCQPPPSPTRQQQPRTGGGGVEPSVSPQPTPLPGSPQPSRTPTPTPSPRPSSPTPSPSCLVSVSRICVVVRTPAPRGEPGSDRARHGTEAFPMFAVPPWPLSGLSVADTLVWLFLRLA